MLRGRIDSCDYSVDQLLLGTILFTLLVFLFPTTFVYYLLFFLLHSAVGYIQVTLKPQTLTEPQNPNETLTKQTPNPN